MSDSRMFLCPVAICSGLAYTGTSGFARPTLGIYLEWWTHADDAMQTSEDGRRLLVYKMAGSPLSGMNRCGVVYEDGGRDGLSLSSFSSLWRPFMEINRRYNAAKYLYEAYSLQEVLEILKAEDAGDDLVFGHGKLSGNNE